MLTDLGLIDKQGCGTVYIQALSPKGYGSEATPVAKDDGHGKLRYWDAPNKAHAKASHTLRWSVSADGSGDCLDVGFGRGEKRKWKNSRVFGRGAVCRHLTDLNWQGFAIYVVVNPGGTENADITEARCIFWEHDHKPKAEQAAIFAQIRDELGGGGFAIETRSSFHCYFRLQSPVAPDKWVELQKRIIHRLGSDPSIKNPARLMRLPGFDHTSIVPGESGQPYKIERVAIDYLHHWDGYTTSLEVLEAVFPSLPPEPTSESPQPRRAPVGGFKSDSIFDEFLNRHVYPVLTPERLFNGLGLKWKTNRWQGPCPWHVSTSGTAFWGKETKDGATFWFACPTCTNDKGCPPLALAHGLRTGTAPTPGAKLDGPDFTQALRDLADITGSRSELEELLTQNQNHGNGPVIHGATFFPPDDPNFVNCLNLSIPAASVSVPMPYSITPDSAPSPAPAMAIAAPPISDPFAAFGMPSLADLAAQAAQIAAPDAAGEVVGRLEVEEFEAATQQLSSAIDFSAAETLPPAMARKMIADAGTLSVPQAYLFGALLTASLSQMGHGDLYCKGRHVPNSAYVALLGEPSSGKTRTRYIYQPILDREVMKRAVHKTALKQWEKDQKASAKAKTKQPKTETFSAYGEALEPQEEEKPSILKAAFENATIEALCRGLDGVTDSKSGVLFASDEIGNVIGSVSKYSQGNDTGRSTLLSLWDGMSPMLIDRVDDERSYAIGASRVSLFVGAETDKLGKYLSDDGLAARLLLVYPDAVHSLMTEEPDDDTIAGLQLSADLPKLYEYLAENNWAGLKTTPEAQVEYAKIHNRYSVLAGTKTSAANAKMMTRFYGKAAGQVLRVAMALHAIECFYSADKCRQTVTRSTIIRAFDFVQLSAGWWGKYWAEQSPTVKASGVMLKILELTKEHGGSLTLGTYSRQISQVRQLIKAEKEINPHFKPAEVVLALCKALEEQGLGSVEDAGRGGYKFVIAAGAPIKSPLTAFGDADRVAQIISYKPEHRADIDRPKLKPKESAQTTEQQPIQALQVQPIEVGSAIEVVGPVLPDGTASAEPIPYNANTNGCVKPGAKAEVIAIENHGGIDYAKVRFEDPIYAHDPVGYLPLTAVKALAVF